MTSEGFGDIESATGDVAATADTPTEFPQADAVPDGAPQPDESEAVLVVAVTEDAEDQPFDEDQLEQLADAHRAEVDGALADLQRELAGMAQTGIPGVDAALARLGELDPNDLNGSTQILAEVLGQLEGVMNETPKE